MPEVWAYKQRQLLCSRSVSVPTVWSFRSCRYRRRNQYCLCRQSRLAGSRGTTAAASRVVQRQAPPTTRLGRVGDQSITDTRRVFTARRFFWKAGDKWPFVTSVNRKCSAWTIAHGIAKYHSPTGRPCQRSRTGHWTQTLTAMIATSRRAISIITDAIWNAVRDAADSSSRALAS
jgi:hypothetical protein